LKLQTNFKTYLAHPIKLKYEGKFIKKKKKQLIKSFFKLNKNFEIYLTIPSRRNHSIQKLTKKIKKMVSKPFF
jgi:hypothetical protein